MYVYIYIYIYIYICVCVYVYMYVCVSLCPQVFYYFVLKLLCLHLLNIE